MKILEVLKLKKKQEQGFSVSAVVTRADGTKEDLGNIGEGTISFQPEGK